MPANLAELAGRRSWLQPSSSARLSLSRSCGRARCTLATPVAAVQSSESATLAPQQTHTQEAAWAPIIAGASSLLVASSAWAEDVEDVIIESTGDEAQALNDVLAAVQQEQSSYDLFVSIMFTGVVGSLAVVTLGIAYLSLRQWLDQRQEEEDKQAALNPKKVFENVDKIKPEEKDMDDAMALSLKKSFQAKRDKTKGFGGNVTTTPKEF